MAKRKSDALKRVLKNYKSGIKREPSYEGIFFSNEQLLALSTYLIENGQGIEALCFMIGKMQKEGEKPIKTVEVIPYSHKKGEMLISEDESSIGNFLVHLPKHPITKLDFILSNMDLAFGGAGSSQRTPPPRVGQ